MTDTASATNTATGTSRSTVAATAREQGYPYRAAVELLQGCKVAEIAQRAGVSARTVNGWVQEVTEMTPTQWRHANGWIGRSITSAAADRITARWCADPMSSPEAVASELGETAARVSTVVEARGLPAHPGLQGTSKPSAEVLVDIATAYAAGATTVELAERYGVHEKTIRRNLETLGVSRRTRGGWTPLTEDLCRKVVSEYRDTPTLDHVASQTGLGTERISLILREAGETVLSGGNRPKTHTRKRKDNTSEERDAVIAAWHEHPALGAVERATGIGHRRARRILWEAGIAVPVREKTGPRKTDDEVRDAVIAAWHERPHRLGHIEAVTGVGKARARRLLFAAGLIPSPDAPERRSR